MIRVKRHEGCTSYRVGRLLIVSRQMHHWRIGRYEFGGVQVGRTRWAVAWRGPEEAQHDDA